MIRSLWAWLRPRLNAQSFCLALLILQPVWFYWRTVIGLRSHIPYDIESYHLPQIAYLAQCLRDGVMPLWDPYQYLGMPIHADVQAQLFYPPTWIVILLGNLTEGRCLFYFIEWMNPAHMILAGVVTFILLRRMGLRVQTALLGASVFQLGSFFASQAQHLGAICAAGWLPLAALSVFELRRSFRIRWVAVLAVSVAMSILAGFTAATIVVAAAVILFAIALVVLRECSWRVAGPIAAGFLWGALIAAVILLPLWTLTQLSMASQRSLWSTTGGGLPLASLVSLVLPNHYHLFDLANFKRQDNYTFLYTYCGIVPVVLIALAPFRPRAKAAVFFALTLIVIIWMLGDNTPVYAFIFTHLPRLFRGALYPEFAMIAFAFFAAITAAFALNQFSARLPQALLWALALFTSWDLVHTGWKRPMNTAQGGPRLGDPYREDLTSNEVAGKTFRGLVDQTSPPSRIDYMDTAFRGGVHAAGMMRLPTPDGDNPFMLIRVRRLRLLYADGEYWQRLTSVNRPGSPLLGMLNVSYFESAKPLTPRVLAESGLEASGDVEGMKVYRNPHSLPRFFLTPSVRKSTGEDDSFRLLADPSFNPSTEAIAEDIPADLHDLAVAPVHVDSWTEDRIELSVTTSGPAFLVSSEVLYPGWVASVNGAPENIVMTNGAFRGLPLKAGAHRIVMEYRPMKQLVGILITLLAAIPALVLIVSPHRFTRKIHDDRPYPASDPVKLDPRTLGREAIAWLPLACFFAIAGYGLFGPVPFGLANNGDFPRVLGAFRLWSPREALHDDSDKFRYFVNNYVVSDPSYVSGVPSSETILVGVARFATKIFLPPGTFKMQFLGALHLAMFALAIFIFLFALRRHAWWLRLLCGFSLVLIWSDLEYVQQFSTAYTDAGAIGALAICYAIAVYCLLNQAASWKWPAAFALSACFLLAAKTQHLTALLAFIPCALFFAYRAARRVDRAAWLAVPVLLLATTGWLLSNTPSDYRTPPAFTVVFSKIVRLAPDAKDVLADFHMPESEFLQYVGHYWYESSVPHDDKAFKARILQLVSPTTLASYYLRHPAVAIKILLADLHESAAEVALPTYGNLSREDLAAGRKPFTLRIWSGFRHSLFNVAPNHLVFVFLLAIAFCAVAIAKPDFRRRWPTWPLVLFGILLAVPSYLFASLLDAAETARHLVFFQMSTDLMLLSAVVTGALNVEIRQLTVPQWQLKPNRRVLVYAAAAVVLIVAAATLPLWFRTRTARVFDDASPEIHFSGSWQHGRYENAANGTTSFSNEPGSKATFSFNGTGITWIYAKAWNRGLASVKIDGIARDSVDQYSPTIVWRSQTTFTGLSTGRHTIEIEVTGRKGQAAKDSFVDLDELIVR